MPNHLHLSVVKTFLNRTKKYANDQTLMCVTGERKGEEDGKKMREKERSDCTATAT